MYVNVLNMLHEFLIKERQHILDLCHAKLLEVSASKSTSEEMDGGLPIFYDEFIEVLRADEEKTKTTDNSTPQNIHRDSAVRRGRESFNLGYTVSQVVHGYGTLCQAITEYASNHSESISAHEFNRLNFCLDVAIAESVTEFAEGQRNTVARKEVLRLGYLAHEMRNALSNAAMAHQMIKKGVVGIGGSTNMVLEEALQRMKNIIDRSLAEVRLQGQPTLDMRRCRIIDLISEVEATAVLEANDRSVRLHVRIPPNLVILVDRHLMVSAISNLVQNAIKFTKADGHVWIRCLAKENRVLIEVEDQCGGLPPGKVDSLFEPFIQKDLNTTGVGLGLSISRGAIELCEGTISARDIPGRGCVFTIDLPLIPVLSGEAEVIPTPIH